MNIILLAPPAAGKGTQAELLDKKYHLNHISTGDLLRSAASREDDFGKKLKEIMASGALVSDEIVLELLEKHLEQSTNHNLLFDGFPRTIHQAELLDEMLEKKNDKIHYVFLLDVEEDILKKRITGRRICKNCNSVYNVNIEALNPKQENTCDKCGEMLYQRGDDNEEAFKIRYQEYIEKTSPLINYYQDKQKLYRIDSNQQKEIIFDSICKIIENNKQLF